MTFRSNMERVHTYRGRMVHEVAKAFLVDIEGHDEEIWLPKSQVDWNGGSEFTIPDWLVREKDLPKPRGTY